MTTVTEQLLYTTTPSPIGELLLVGDGDRLRALRFSRRPARIGDSWRRAEEPFAEARRQLDEYFAGVRAQFELELAPPTTAPEFDRRVWAQLERIPYGRTAGYGEVARSIGEPGAARAVGVANGRNPFAIIVPCHRVIGADGSLTGYGGGIERKRFLLELEGALLPVQRRAG
jgi:methylated-DNA-[protein]-cysteine S-methyltransferase